MILRLTATDLITENIVWSQAFDFNAGAAQSVVVGFPATDNAYALRPYRIYVEWMDAPKENMDASPVIQG